MRETVTTHVGENLQLISTIFNAAFSRLGAERYFSRTERLWRCESHISRARLLSRSFHRVSLLVMIGCGPAQGQKGDLYITSDVWARGGVRYGPQSRVDFKEMQKPPEFRYVIVHKPGPNWAHGSPPLEQSGLQAHVAHYRSLLQTGKLSMGGPFMDEAAGGMMIPETGVSEAEIRRFAAEDPAVQSGLLIFDVRPWLPAFHN